MPSSRPLTRHPRCDLAATLLVLLCLAGCAAAPTSTSRPSASRTVLEPAADIERPAFGQTVAPRTLPLIPVAREGRYTLVELAPEAGQQDLMQQIVEVTVPATLTATVGDALRYVLYRSGFELCQSPDIRLLDHLPLPAADLHLGPLTLESALRILAGPGWNLRINQVIRQVCFVPVSLPSPTGRHRGARPAAEADAASAGHALIGKSGNRP